MSRRRRVYRTFQAILWGVAVVVVGRVLLHAERHRTINDLRYLGARVTVDSEERPIALCLHGGELSESQLRSIAEWQHLNSLILTDCRVAEDGLQPVYELPELRVIEFSFTDLPRYGLSGVERARSLHSLSLLHCAWVDDAEIAHLLHLDGLEELHLSKTSISDAGLAQLAALPRLEELSIDGCALITDEGLMKLSDFPALRRVRGSELNVAPETFARLRAARPDLMLRGSARRTTVSPIPAD